jgi:hypothetical protein
VANMTRQWLLELGIWDFRSTQGWPEIGLRFKYWRFELPWLIGAWDLEFPVETTSAGNTSKELDKNVVSRVILHAQCSLQRKEAR